MTYLICGIVAAIIGMAFIVFSIYGKKNYYLKKQRCTATADGKLIRFAKKEYQRGGDDDPTYYDLCYFPVYEYTVDGQRYEVQGSRGRSKPDESLIGQSQQILYNPEKCSESYVSGENIKHAFTIIQVVGIILIVVGIINLSLFIF